jgi:hypothetical protein
MKHRRLRRRRNAPISPADIAAMKRILAAHGAACNPKRRRVKRRISASLRRKLLANLRKARRARWGRKSRR